MSRLFCGAFAGHKVLGLPPVDRLRDYEQRTAQLFDPPAIEDDQCSLKIKPIALFLANKGGSHYFSWPECERFFRICSGPLYTHGGEAAPSLTAQALSCLHRVLLAQGDQGVRAFLTASVSPEQSLVQLWTVMANKTLLDEADLALLDNYYKQLSLEPSPLWLSEPAWRYQPTPCSLGMLGLFRHLSRGLVVIPCYPILIMISMS